MHRPITLKNISLSFPGKSCFEEFSAQIQPGSRIAIIGRNGSGKSSLIKLLARNLAPSDGEIIFPEGLCTGYVKQTIDCFNELSGGQRLNKSLSEALSKYPELLLLDEPTNHLDTNNRKSLMHMLNRYQGTLVVISHDRELLRHCVDTLWHIEGNKVHIFNGSYDDYQREIQNQRSATEKALSSLKQQKKAAHNALMKEQERAAKSKKKGQKSIDQKKWPTVVSAAKVSRANQTSGKNQAAIDKKKEELNNALSNLHLPEIILPKFSLEAGKINSGNLVSINSATIGYVPHEIILEDVNLTLNGKERIAICGNNASGKSTFLKAILGKEEIFITGNYQLPRIEYVGYLDQHYANLEPKRSIIDQVRDLRPDWTDTEARRHLNDFLFKTNEEINQTSHNLSGGEKARASLSLIAAKTPSLLVLDEITNNLDLETKEHVAQVLKAYPGAMVIVSHEKDFLEAMDPSRTYVIENGSINEKY